MTQSPEMTSGWVRTNQAPGLKRDHIGRYSGEPLKPDLLNPKNPDFTVSSSPRLAHFLSLSPVKGNRTTADLKSPIFLPSQTCQVTEASAGLSGKSE